MRSRVAPVLLAALTVSLVLIAAPRPTGAVSSTGDPVFINEIHYDNTGDDAGEFVELAGPAGTDLTGWGIYLYSGADGTNYDLHSLSGVIDDEGAGYGAISVALPMQNGDPDGLALVDGTTVVQFLSYEGTFTGSSGPANGLLSTDIGVAEDGDEAVGTSLGLTGVGTTYGHFTWATGLDDSPGSINPGQSLPLCAATTPIGLIQGTGALSPQEGAVHCVEGVVTGDFQGFGSFGGFYVQSLAPDADPLTSEGIFIFSSAAVALGDQVRVRGRVTEFNGLTEIANVVGVEIVSTGNALPPAVVYDLPRAEGVTFEPVESMLVTFPETLTASDHFALGRFGEVTLSSDGRIFEPTELFDPGVPAAEAAAYNARRRLLIDDGSNQQNQATVPFLTPDLLRLGDTTSGITGVLDFRFGLFRLQPIAPITFARTNPRPAAPDAVGGDVRVASLNSQNFFTTLPSANPDARGANNAAEFTRQRDKLVAALLGLDADIVGLIEIENNGATALGSLVDGLNAEAGPGAYAAITEPALNAPNSLGGTFGTEPIKVAMIYQPAVVTPVGAAQSSSDAIFDRPPLIQTFEQTGGGEDFTVAVNHFKSKACDSGAIGPDADQGDGQLCYNSRRVLQATALDALVDTIAASKALLIGDFNSYTQEDPLGVLDAAGYTGLAERFIAGSDRYSFMLDAASGALDHALASAALLANVTGATIWHVNADEPNLIDYNTEFKGIDLYEPDAYRSSDHDPLVVGLDLAADAPPTFSIDDVTVDEGDGTATFTVTRTNDDGAASVDVTLPPGVATIPADYTATPTTLNFADGEATKPFVVTIVQDPLDENDERYFVRISNPVNGTIADESATGRILDDDPLPTVSVADKTIVEGNSGTKNLVFTVSLSAASGREVRVRFRTVNGTATGAGSDFASRNFVLVFAPGQVSKGVIVAVNGDTTPEPDETFTVQLSEPFHAAIGDGTAVGRINNDD